jgi:hypothetical protein
MIHSLCRRSARLRYAIALLAFLAAAVPALAEPLIWRIAELAVLRVDDVPPKEWNIYLVERKFDRLLVQAGERFLFVNVNEKRVFGLDAAAIERRGPDLLWDPASRPANPLATSNWIARDVGLAYRVRFRLDAEGRVLDLQISHSAGRP